MFSAPSRSVVRSRRRGPSRGPGSTRPRYRSVPRRVSPRPGRLRSSPRRRDASRHRPADPGSGPDNGRHGLRPGARVPVGHRHSPSSRSQRPSREGLLAGSPWRRVAARRHDGGSRAASPCHRTGRLFEARVRMGLYEESIRGNSLGCHFDDRHRGWIETQLLVQVRREALPGRPHRRKKHPFDCGSGQAGQRQVDGEGQVDLKIGRLAARRSQVVNPFTPARSRLPVDGSWVNVIRRCSMNSIRSVNTASTFNPSASMPLNAHRHCDPVASIDRTSGVKSASVVGSVMSCQISSGPDGHGGDGDVPRREPRHGAGDRPITSALACRHRACGDVLGCGRQWAADRSLRGSRHPPRAGWGRRRGARGCPTGGDV